MKLYEILKGSEYSLDMFSQEVIAELENRIIERIDKKGKTYPVVSCLVRNKEIKLTPEEIEVFKESVQPVYESQTAGSEWQADYVKRLQDAFAAL